MDLWQLYIFRTVVEKKSFSKAGKIVHLSQPTISSHIKDLESHFGCRLIDRLPKQVMPTREGLLLYDYARRMIALKEEAEDALAQFQKSFKGPLAVGGSTIPGSYFLPRIIGDFYRKYPEIEISLAIADTEQILGEILSGRLSLGIVGARSTDKRVLQEPIIRDKMRLIVPKHHRYAKKKRIDLQRLIEEPFIIREGGSGTLKSIRKCLDGKNIGIEDLRVVAELGSTVAVIQGIKSGVGVSILSTIAVREEIATGALKAVEIEGLELDRHFYLSRHRQRALSPVSRVFWEFIQEISHDKSET